MLIKPAPSVSPGSLCASVCGLDTSSAQNLVSGLVQKLRFLRWLCRSVSVPGAKTHPPRPRVSSEQGPGTAATSGSGAGWTECPELTLAAACSHLRACQPVSVPALSGPPHPIPGSPRAPFFLLGCQLTCYSAAGPCWPQLSCLDLPMLPCFLVPILGTLPGCFGPAAPFSKAHILQKIPS